MITQETLEKIASQVNQAGVSEAIVSSLRSEYKSIHFTYCDDDDIPNNEPVLEQQQFNLYLIDGRDHCLCLTSQLESATGVVVAEIYQ